ncbi:MAG: hypothetical protein V4690_02400 [Patescibacteria group bacterium]
MDLEKSSIERLKRTLYSRDESLVPKEKHTPVSPIENNVKTDWGTNTSFELEKESTPMAKTNNSFFHKFLGISAAFFVVSLGIAVFMFYGGLNTISSNNLDVEITAPSIVASGEEFVMGLSVINGNPTEIQDVNLFVTYPNGSKEVTNSTPLSFEKIPLGNIESGESKDYVLRSLVFGEKDAVRSFVLRIEYKVVGSNATFSKEKSYDVVIGSSPVILELSYPSEITSGQEFTLSIDITTNSASVIQDALMKVDFPYGFTYETSNLKPVRDSMWNIGDLKNGEKKTISITGSLVGQNNEERSFQISLGTESADSVFDFDTILVADVATIAIRKSFFDLAVSAGEGNIGRIGQTSSVNIDWQNTLPDKLINNKITAKISGNVLNRSSVSPSNGGYYESLSGSVIWDKNNLPKLETLNPGDNGQVSLSLGAIQNPNSLLGIENPHIDIAVTVEGVRSGIETGSVFSEEKITIKFPSTLGFTSKTFRSGVPLGTTGPIPPKADTETTYIIAWTLTNTTNNLEKGTVSATLPLGVVWKGEVSPSTEKVTYDEGSRAVYWNVGNISRGAGFQYSPKTVYFKVGIIPSLTQVGSTPALLLQTNAAAEDSYTKTPINIGASSATTAFTDPNFKTSDGTVIK